MARHDTATTLLQRIDATEARLMQHEHQLRGTWLALQQRVKAQRSPARWGPPLAGAAATLGALWWLAHRNAPPPRPRREHRDTGEAMQHSARAALPWAQMATLAWPLLPARWRPRVPPSVAIGVLSAVLPLARRALEAVMGGGRRVRR